MNPFDALGLPTDPALSDEQVHAAWKTIAAATHPDRPDGGDPARYTQASAAYTELRSRGDAARPTPTGSSTCTTPPPCRPSPSPRPGPR